MDSIVYILILIIAVLTYLIYRLEQKVDQLDKTITSVLTALGIGIITTGAEKIEIQIKRKAEPNFKDNKPF